MPQQQDSRTRRIYEEVLALSRWFGSVDWDDDEGRWVLIYQLRLLSQYKKKRFTACLIDLPPTYPETHPDGAYVDPDLEITSSHYYYLRYSDKGYKWICAHPQTWNPAVPWPQGDNLFTVVASVKQQLELLKPRKGQR
jgi:E2/UBC family protein E